MVLARLQWYHFQLISYGYYLAGRDTSERVNDDVLFCLLGSIFSFLPLQGGRKFKNIRDLRFLIKTLCTNWHLVS